MVSVCNATAGSLTDDHGRNHPDRPRRRPPVRRGRARLPAGAGDERRGRRAAGLGRAADAAGQMPVRFHHLGDGDDLLLDCEAEAADDLVKRLAIYRLRRPIRSSATTSLAVHWSPDGRGVARSAPCRARQPLACAGGRAGERLARAPPAPRRLRRPRRARRHPLARMQRRRAERRQLHQGLLRRPGEYRADELAAEGQPPAGRRRRAAGGDRDAGRLSRARPVGRASPRRAIPDERDHSRLAEAALAQPSTA